MKNLIIIDGYKSKLNIVETEKAIKFVKDNFERDLAEELSLVRVSAPLFVLPSTGLNDELDGKVKRIDFSIKGIEENAEIVQSLAKWKRSALAKYNFSIDEGLYTDMNAIRKEEDLDNIHSAYVDQWDWEKIILKENRNIDFLKTIVRKIYNVLLVTERRVIEEFPSIEPVLPNDIYFISSFELEKLYPNLSPVQREYEICKEKKAVFITQIGAALSNGKPHSDRAADYDDWDLNGDLLLYYKELDIALEISSMGIRVDENSVIRQLLTKNEGHKVDNSYIKGIINKKLPYTIGGGIGQSRICMFFLKKAHIGEVQVSVWDDNDIKLLNEKNIFLL